MNRITFRLKSCDAQSLNGFVKVMTSNGYRVTFREGGNHNVLMCDVGDDKCKIQTSEAVDKIRRTYHANCEDLADLVSRYENNETNEVPSESFEQGYNNGIETVCNLLGILLDGGECDELSEMRVEE